MKKLLTVTLLLCMTSSLFGKLKVPRYAHKVENLTEAAFKKLRSVAVIVFVNSRKSERHQLPEAAKLGLNSKNAGVLLPKATITDANAEKHLLSIKAKELEKPKKTMRRVKKSLAELDDPAEQEEQKKETPKAKDHKYYQWTNFEGKNISAQFVKIEDDHVVLKLRSGKQVNYTLEKLASDSQELAKSLGAASK